MDRTTDGRMTLGDKIRAARLEAGLAQDEMAGKLFVSRQAITKWENGKGVPDIGNLRRLARLLGVSVDYLLDDGEDAEAATRAARTDRPDVRRCALLGGQRMEHQGRQKGRDRTRDVAGCDDPPARQRADPDTR